MLFIDLAQTFLDAAGKSYLVNSRIFHWNKISLEDDAGYSWLVTEKQFSFSWSQIPMAKGTTIPLHGLSNDIFHGSIIVANRPVCRQVQSTFFAAGEGEVRRNMVPLWFSGSLRKRSVGCFMGHQETPEANRSGPWTPQTKVTLDTLTRSGLVTPSWDPLKMIRVHCHGRTLQGSSAT